MDPNVAAMLLQHFKKHLAYVQVWLSHVDQKIRESSEEEECIREQLGRLRKHPASYAACTRRGDPEAVKYHYELPPGNGSDENEGLILLSGTQLEQFLDLSFSMEEES